MSDWPDHYLILGVDRNATPQEIKEAYRFKAFTQHPDRLTDAPESVRNKAEEEFKKLSIAYESLRDPQKRDQYNSEWDNKRRYHTGKNAGGNSSVAEPKPIVDPDDICFGEAESGETRNASFIIRNEGGSYDNIWFSNPDSWVKVISWDSVNNIDQLPLRVEIEAKGNEWNKKYFEEIRVKLDEQETKVRLELRTKARPSEGQCAADQQNTANNKAKSSRSKGRVAYYIAVGVLAILLFYGYNLFAPVLFGSSALSLPSFIDGTGVSHIGPQTAFTRDGINFVSRERMQENIDYEYAKPGDYREVQVPPHTVVVGASVIPGETAALYNKGMLDE